MVNTQTPQRSSVVCYGVILFKQGGVRYDYILIPRLQGLVVHTSFMTGVSSPWYRARELILVEIVSKTVSSPEYQSGQVGDAKGHGGKKWVGMAPSKCIPFLQCGAVGGGGGQGINWGYFRATLGRATALIKNWRIDLLRCNIAQLVRCYDCIYISPTRYRREVAFFVTKTFSPTNEL